MLWGNFSEIGAVFENVWLTDRTVPPHLKGSAKQGIKAQKVWHSKVYVQFEQAGATRTKTEGKVVEFIREIIEKGHYPDSRFGRGRFEQIISRDDISASFRQNKLPRAGEASDSIEALARNTELAIPPTEPTAYHL